MVFHVISEGYQQKITFVDIVKKAPLTCDVSSIQQQSLCNPSCLIFFSIEFFLQQPLLSLSVYPRKPYTDPGESGDAIPESESDTFPVLNALYSGPVGICNF